LVREDFACFAFIIKYVDLKVVRPLVLLSHLQNYLMEVLAGTSLIINGHFSVIPGT